MITQVLLAGVKRNALELRQKELEFNVERFTNLATQASVIAGFSFESLVELEVPEETNWILSSTYFVFGSMAMALSLYCLVISSFACVFGHRLALQVSPTLSHTRSLSLSHIHTHPTCSAHSLTHSLRTEHLLTESVPSLPGPAR